MQRRVSAVPTTVVGHSALTGATPNQLRELISRLDSDGLARVEAVLDRAGLTCPIDMVVCHEPVHIKSGLFVGGNRPTLDDGQRVKNYEKEAIAEYLWAQWTAKNNDNQNNRPTGDGEDILVGQHAVCPLEDDVRVPIWHHGHELSHQGPFVCAWGTAGGGGRARDVCLPCCCRSKEDWISSLDHDTSPFEPATAAAEATRVALLAEISARQIATSSPVNAEVDGSANAAAAGGAEESLRPSSKTSSFGEDDDDPIEDHTLSSDLRQPSKRVQIPVVVSAQRCSSSDASISLKLKQSFIAAPYMCQNCAQCGQVTCLDRNNAKHVCCPVDPGSMDDEAWTRAGAATTAAGSHQGDGGGSSSNSSSGVACSHVEAVRGVNSILIAFRAYGAKAYPRRERGWESNALSGFRRENCHENKLEGVPRSIWEFYLSGDFEGKSFARTGNALCIGELPGVEAGMCCRSRVECDLLRLHCRWMEGIEYVRGLNTCLPSVAIVTKALWSGQAAVVKYGDRWTSDTVLDYCGAGGNDTSYTNQQLSAQSFDTNTSAGKANTSLKLAGQHKTPVRLIQQQPNGEYQYLGLYMVTAARWHTPELAAEQSPQKFDVCQHVKCQRKRAAAAKADGNAAVLPCGIEAHKWRNKPQPVIRFTLSRRVASVDAPSALP